MPTAPTYPDATGYINLLATETALPWFTELVRIAANGGAYRQLTRDDLDRIVLVMRGGALSQLTSPPTTSPTPATTTALGWIEWLGQFTNFKRLPSSLVFKPAQHVTIVFGKNGSGKTSLCDAFKALANPEEPRRPLGNVRNPSGVAPSFKIKFSGEATERTFAKPYGSLSNTIRYFDTSIANHNVRVAVAPERVVQLAPFKLADFDALRGYVTQIKTDLVSRHTTLTTEKRTLLDRLRPSVGSLPGSVFNNPNSVSRRDVEAAISDGAAFPGPQALVDHQQILVDIEKASTATGLKLLQGEIRDIDRLLPSMIALVSDVDRLWSLRPGVTAGQLRDAETRQQALTAAVIPAGIKTDVFIQFLRSVKTINDISVATAHTACPLCRQEIGASGEVLFKQYHAILMGAVEHEIAGCRKSLAEAKAISELIPGRLPADLGGMTIEDALRQRVVKAGADLLPHIKLGLDGTPEAVAARDSFHSLIAIVAEMRDRKKAAHAAAESGVAGQSAALNKAKNDVGVLTRQSLHGAALPDLRALMVKFDDEQWYIATIAALTPLLKQISMSRRKAHDELVLETFVERLNAEYKILAECKMEDLGVVLSPKTMGKGEDAEIALEGLVGPSGTRGGKQTEALHDVLSEGELRLHAMALFFAEVETSNHSVIIFDDPASSFDYDRVENYGIRLRDFATKHPNRQIIVLTHCWEFFVHLQQSLKRPILPNIQVLENCATVAEYAEDVAVLKGEIQRGLQVTAPLTDDQKVVLAGKMRRLIETFVNDLVFNKQRHQYKNKGFQKVSTFNEFTRIVALKPDEAQEFGDLYRKLSHAEHADHMNNIVSADKVVMQSRYDAILSVAARIIARVPPP